MLEKIFVLWENYVMASRFGYWRPFQKVSEFLLTQIAMKAYLEMGISPPNFKIRYTKSDDEERYSTIPNMVYWPCIKCEQKRMFSLQNYYNNTHALVKCEICDSEQSIPAEDLKKLTQYWEM